jgi:hypothetical protein
MQPWQAFMGIQPWYVSTPDMMPLLWNILPSNTSSISPQKKHFPGDFHGRIAIIILSSFFTQFPHGLLWDSFPHTMQAFIGGFMLVKVLPFPFSPVPDASYPSAVYAPYQGIELFVCAVVLADLLVLKDWLVCRASFGFFFHYFTSTLRATSL